MFAPEQHDLYDSHCILSANRIYMVGGLNDPAGWNHMDNDAKTVKPVAGTELARLFLLAGLLVLLVRAWPGAWSAVALSVAVLPNEG